ncbi:helix-turn-helix domain-containing protein [Lactiplantibacillus plantarum]|uniref:helix-turn-helix domain-containing protein n=1 Tax=Lactiplantibacillus plantarum TaxID=1590 RepID=UPI0009318CF1|nr:helix-turn-helix transcriptional regulator [Lactiplantibacillus plantarum]ASX22662.1 transcriptional regulator [Lactiplantibacillus plantarum]QDJ18021.1 XRE family transcriptional regulator [Lactiplantibacillus plantarum]RHF46951.1 XRE family transcriptional regulator [Lactiplantibacillus plantarum]WMY71044.1 helix-turn-helix transcriptional regulator [Lactiplantibacillus plantarum]
MNKFPEQLKKLRKETNTTQDDLATKLFVTRQAISKWESGDSTPDLTNLIKLTDIFNVSLDTLVFGAEKITKVDATEFTFDPKRNRYVRKLGRMNFWDFLAGYWWLVISLVVIIGFFWSVSR